MEIVVKKDNWAKIRANLSLAKKSYVAVGWPSGKPKTNAMHDPISGATNGEVAIYNEMGTAPGSEHPRPARPMVAESVKRNKAQIKALQVSGMKGITEGTMSCKLALEHIGRFMQGEIIESIRMPAGGWKAENSKRTIAAKGSDTPLVDGGKLSQSVSWDVRMRSANQKHAWDTMTQRRRAARLAEQGPA